MALQFNEHFVRIKLKPTLKTLLERMNQPVDADPKGVYLRKLTIPESLSSLDKDAFNREYFEGTDQDPNRPFMDESEKQYREYLLEELEAFIRGNITLFGGSERMKRMILPSEDKSFDTSADLQRHLNTLAYRMVARFEKKLVAEKMGDVSKEEQEKIDNGEYKIAEIDGERKVLSINQIDGLDPSSTVVPLVQPGLMQSLNAPQDQQTVPTEGSVSATAAEFKDSFQDSRLESYRQTLENAGLNVLKIALAADGSIEGLVEDVDANQLKVEINITAGNDDPKKFKFTFQDPIHDQSDDRYYGGRFFHLSQDDLNNRFLQNGQRISADNVYGNVPESSKFKGYEVPAPSQLPVDTVAPGGGPTKLPAEEGAKPEDEVAKPGQPQITGLPEAPAGPPPEFTPVVAPPTKAVTKPDKAKKKPGITTKIKPAAPPPKTKKEQTVKEKKEEVAARKMEEQQRENLARQQQMLNQRQLAAAAVAQQQQQNQQQRIKQQKAHRKRFIGYIAAASGVAGAGPLAAILAGISASGSGEDQAGEAVSFILNCIGGLCFC